MRKNPYAAFRAIGKGWASSVARIRRAGYVKTRQVPVEEAVVFCRGWQRAAKRRDYKAIVKAASSLA